MAAADGNRPEKRARELEETPDLGIESLEEGDEEMTVVLPDEVDSSEADDVFMESPEAAGPPARGVGLKSSLGSFRDTERVPSAETLAISDEEILGTSERKASGERMASGDRQATGALGESSARASRGGTPLAEDLDLEREDTEEVFVILPEQLDSEIPMVDTEVVAELDDFDGDTEVVGGVNDPNFDSDEIYDGPTQFAEDGEYEGPTEPVDPSDLDHLTSDLDDEALVDGAAHYDDEFEFSAESHAGARGRGRLFAVLAALAVVAVTAGYFAWDRFYGPPVVAEAVQTAPPPPPVVDSRDLLRERLDLAISRGFESEVSE